MRVVVTGGAGFIGSHLTERLLASGHHVTIIDNLSSGKRTNVPANVDFIHANMGSPEGLAALADARPDALVLFAAQMDVRRSVEDPGHDAQMNIIEMLAVLEAARRINVKAIVFASTGGAIYGDTDVLPTPETHPTRPESPYGCSKAAGELYLGYYRKIHNLPSVALRFANVYGPRQDPHGEAGVVAIFAQRMLRNEPITIFGDGSQTRDFVYVGDVARACELALLRQLDTPGFGGVFNVGTGIETTVNTLAAHIATATAYATPPRHAPGRPGEQRRSVIDGTLAAQMLGFSPEIAVKEGLTRTVDYFRGAEAKGAHRA